jgi:hypothetical protein
MPATLNPVRKALLKKNLLNPKLSVKDALLRAGYSPTTAHNSTKNISVKICQAEIQAELRVRDITTEWLLGRYLSAEALAIQKQDPAAFTLIINSIAKYVVKEPERVEIVITPDEKSEYERLRGRIVVDIIEQADDKSVAITPQVVDTQGVKQE